MKVLIFILVLLIVGCSSKNRRPLHDSILDNDTSVLVYNIPRYEADSILLPVLNEVINDEKQCVYSQSYTSCFSLTFKTYERFTDMYFEERDFFNYYPQQDIGYFVYLHKVFLIKLPVVVDGMFHSTNDTAQISKKKDQKEPFPFPNDEGSSWLYRYESKSVKLVQKSVCRY